MFSMRQIATRAALAATILIATGAMEPAIAQQYSGMTCGELWYARNKIYADNGFCFKTQRARQQFGEGCFPPYGRVSGYAKERIDTIQYWESRRGCR